MLETFAHSEQANYLVGPDVDTDTMVAEQIPAPPLP